MSIQKSQHFFASSTSSSAAKQQTEEELQEQMQLELEMEMELQHGPSSKVVLGKRKEITLSRGGDAINDAVWSHDFDFTNRVIPSVKLDGGANEESKPVVVPVDAQRKRVDVNDVRAPVEEVIAQLKLDLAEAQARKDAEHSITFKLANKEAELLALKKHLVKLMCPKMESSPLDIAVKDPLLAHAFRKQAKEIQRLRDELEKERSLKAKKENDLPSHTALGLIQKLHSLQKENALLAKQLEEGNVANKWAMMSLLHFQCNQDKAALNVVAGDVSKLQKGLKDAKQHERKVLLAIQRIVREREQLQQPKESIKLVPSAVSSAFPVDAAKEKIKSEFNSQQQFEKKKELEAQELEISKESKNTQQLSKQKQDEKHSGRSFDSKNETKVFAFRRTEKIAKRTPPVFFQVA